MISYGFKTALNPDLKSEKNGNLQIQLRVDYLPWLTFENVFVGFFTCSVSMVVDSLTY